MTSDSKFCGLKFINSLSEEEGSKILKLVSKIKKFLSMENLFESFFDMAKNMAIS
ncbi:hypothetical protein IHO40_01285 [Wolbachia endosymbiont of Mansonella ozzardi]|uniref:hypothetical protein n=1 Tax=Wolbachia endosymbiont of Mansonella ozzardi TaxID=137464 RepID=UPI001CE0CBCE|nr:hypothetical protein [Wolbachia endosymbiont of Mansonella ozzardi]MCA4774803.1 hypothetical protein [Wolbachia endosymbiont of Mansonella ozzardi]